jgi:predicted enzyme related to lactoylglutathione lyase
MFLGMRTVTYLTPDLAAGKAWYSEVLGYGPYFDEPFYVGFNVAGYELGLVPDGSDTGPGGAKFYWGVSEIETAVERLRSLGASVKEAIHEVGGGIQVATVLDPFGNELGVIYNPHFAL